ncbi:MAG TPA: DHA2 family efflux MFS transporter permease subunit [Methanomicrobiales archaeon]|nr:DHA2 family efflux MFS transporter permease subunit [Methanomicrobiales archaeon]
MTAGPALPPARKRLLLGVVALASFMGALDATIVNISIPAISASLGARLGLVSWVLVGYLLVLSATLLLFGRLGDLRGFRPVFLGGFLAFTAGSLLCGLSTGIVPLIGFRILQGAGAAALQAMGPALVALHLPKEERGKALGILATAVSLGIAGGPILGGIITQYLSWHWIFFINVPVGIVAIAIGTAVVPPGAAGSSSGRFDLAGSGLFFLALLTLLWPLSDGIYLGWTSPPILASLLFSLVFWAAFLRQELRSSAPLLDLRLFSDRSFSFANGASFLIMAALAGSEFLLPFFFERVQGLPTSTAGLLLAIPAIALMVAGPLSGALADRCGTRRFAVGSSLLGAVSFLLLSGFSPESPFPYVLLTLLSMGLAMGFFFPPNMSQILGRCRPEEKGMGSGVMNTAKNVGDTLGTALFGTIALSVIAARAARLPGIPAASLPPDLLTGGFRIAFAAGVLLCIAAAAMSALAREAPGATGEGILIG